MTADALQADNLAVVREVIAAVAEGLTDPDRIAKQLSLNSRVVRDCLHAARILGWIRLESTQLTFGSAVYSPTDADREPVPDATVSLTEAAAELLKVPADSEEERVLIAKALVQSEYLRRVAGDFFSIEVDVETLTKLLRERTGLASMTARRRARSLLAWKRHASGETSQSDGGADREDAAAAQSSVRQDAKIPASEVRTSEETKETSSLELTTAQLGYLRAQIELGRMMVLFGPAFSNGASTVKGEPPPTDGQLAEMVWRLLFGEAAIEDHLSLDDLIATATLKKPKPLLAILSERFSLQPESLPIEYRSWFDLPVPKIYTLAHDDLESAVAQRYPLRRTPTPVTSTYDSVTKDAKNVPVLHLRGCVANGTATFMRVRDRDDASSQRRLVNQFDADFLAYPFLFVGEEADNDLLWEYIQRRGGKAPRGIRELRPKSFLISPQLSRPRRELLEIYNVEWIAARPLDFARVVLAQFTREATLGHAAIASRITDSRSLAASVRSVAALLVEEARHRTDFLLGKQPTWDDIRCGRAVYRDSDAEIEEQAMAALKQPPDGAGVAPVFVLTGTAGSGKSTALMRLGMKLSAEGFSVGWLNNEAEISLKAIDEFSHSEHGFSVIAIDDSDRYGRHTAGKYLRRFSEDSRVSLVITTMHSARIDALPEFLSEGQASTFAIPKLTDSDVSRLLDALEADHKLGVLTGKNRAYQEKVFREKAGRILLVAMIEATSGRRFEEKVYDEWSSLPAPAAYYYILITIATHLQYGLTRDQLLRATEASRQSDDVASLESLVTGRIVDRDRHDRYRARHRLIADTLMKELAKHSNELQRAHVDLAYSVTATATPGSPRSTAYWRFIKKLINYRYLFNALSLSGARNVYDAIERHLHWDYHYWLQRGSLEVGEGDIRHAEQYLNTARSLDPGDDLVVTEYAYMMMRRAVLEPTAPKASETLEEGMRILRGQINSRGGRDKYPYHVLGSQALAWVNRRVWQREERVRLLETVLREIREARQHHPREKDLVSLEYDLKRKLLELSSGIED
jgi:hypothetical protein